MTKRKSLPENMPFDSIKNVYIQELERHSNELIDELQEFIKKPIPSGESIAEITVFPDEYADGYVSISLYWSGIKTSSCSFAKYIDDLPLIDVASYFDEFSIPDLQVNLVKQWFTESWWKAGGWVYPASFTLNGHDGFGEDNEIYLTQSC
ncbi:MAG: hypothetical protein COA79_25610 [Planctomycetota bacterium]|nr:MAG: hypothetical protein COA79_25610 [Planctomycetota bacterium]